MATERCITCYLPVNGGKACTCGCGRLVCSSCGAPKPASEPTATQLYDAVKALRAANGHRVLTIPEINSVLVARAEYVAGVAAGPQATPPLPEVLEEELAAGRLLDAVHMVTGMVELVVEAPEAEYGEWIGETVRVVAAPTSQEPDHG